MAGDLTVYASPADGDGDSFRVDAESDGRFMLRVTQVSHDEGEAVAYSFITVEQVETLLALMRVHATPPRTPEEVESWLEN